MLIITLKAENFIFVQRKLYNNKHGFDDKIQLKYLFGISKRL